MNFSSRFSRGNLLSKFLLILLLLFSFKCEARSIPKGERLVSINIIDRNGMSETISEKARLAPFQKVDFLSPQPYQKVLRVFDRNEKGDVASEITSYYPNGHVQQYLEAVNNRACGLYREWHANGHPKIEAKVIGGVADLNVQAQGSWLFDGVNKAWDDAGHLIACIPYSKGELYGEALYYHPNGKVWKVCAHVKNLPHGLHKVFLADETLLQTTLYQNGVKDGESLRYWSPTQIAWQEGYQNGLLIEGKYYDKKGALLSEVVSGSGFKAIFGKDHLEELQEYKRGEREGLTKLFEENGTLHASFYLKNGEKLGEEIIYYANGTPKLSMMWQEGILQGLTKTWYDNGQLESQKEMSQNKKNGLYTAWYRNGSLMMVEEYDNDKIVKGEYYRSGETGPASVIEAGKGIATLFDSEGNFAKRVEYREGRPLS